MIREGKSKQIVWQCDRCFSGDNQTRFHNLFSVSVQGENVGEEIEEFEHHVELCDRCSKAPDIKAWCLFDALKQDVLV